MVPMESLRLKSHFWQIRLDRSRLMWVCRKRMLDRKHHASRAMTGIPFIQGLDFGCRSNSSGVKEWDSCRLVQNFSGVLVSCGCCDRLPQTAWFKTTEIYSLTVLGARSQSQAWQDKAGQGNNPSGGASVVSFACFFLSLSP